MYIEPSGTFAFDISLNVVLMAAIGGAGTWQGPLIGAPLVLLVADMLRVTVTSEVNRAIFSILVILIALFVPGGVMGVWTRWTHAPKRKPVETPSYTLLAVMSSNTVNATLYKNLRFDFVRDIVPIGLVGDGPFVMVVTPSLPAKTIPEFIAYAKANPGKINMASQGTGTTSHVCRELLKMMTGIDFVPVPYRGPLMPDLLAGQVQLYFSPTPQALPYVKDGRLRALGVTSAKRSAALPDVPAIAEFVPGYAASAWVGIGAPKGTPAEIIRQLNTEIGAVLADPKAQSRLLALGL